MTIAIANEKIHPLDIFIENFIPAEQGLTIQSFKIGQIDFEKLLPACYHAVDSLFYYLSPDASFRFIAGGLHSLPSGFNPGQFLNTLQHSTHAVSGLANIPLLFSKKFFNSLPDDTMWEDFADEWLMPDFVFFSDKKHSVVCTINSSNSLPLQILTECSNNSFSFFDGNHTALDSLSFSASMEFPEFQLSINAIQDAIAKGIISKAVLSRHQSAGLSRPDYSHFLQSLTRFPLTHRFMYKSGNSVFSGASPELLLTMKGRKLQTEALAGTAYRGGNTAEDEAISESLLHDEKELLEHKIVTDYITGILHDYADTIEYSTTPQIKKLAALQHLWTPVKADLKNPESVFTVIDSLFPTPATCGYPRKESFELISSLENFSRGLYCGSIAWSTAKGDVDAFIPLRSALFKNNRVHIFSGGGIVAASDAAAEFEENRRKADTIKSLFFI